MLFTETMRKNIISVILAAFNLTASSATEFVTPMTTVHNSENHPLPMPEPSLGETTERGLRNPEGLLQSFGAWCCSWGSCASRNHQGRSRDHQRHLANDPSSGSSSSNAMPSVVPSPTEVDHTHDSDSPDSSFDSNPSVPAEPSSASTSQSSSKQVPLLAKMLRPNEVGWVGNPEVEDDVCPMCLRMFGPKLAENSDENSDEYCGYVIPFSPPKSFPRLLVECDHPFCQDCLDILCAKYLEIPLDSSCPTCRRKPLRIVMNCSGVVDESTNASSGSPDSFLFGNSGASSSHETYDLSAGDQSGGNQSDQSGDQGEEVRNKSGVKRDPRCIYYEACAFELLRMRNKDSFIKTNLADEDFILLKKILQKNGHGQDIRQILFKKNLECDYCMGNEVLEEEVLVEAVTTDKHLFLRMEEMLSQECIEPVPQSKASLCVVNDREETADEWFLRVEKTLSEEARDFSEEARDLSEEGDVVCGGVSGVVSDSSGSGNRIKEILKGYRELKTMYLFYEKKYPNQECPIETGEEKQSDVGEERQLHVEGVDQNHDEGGGGVEAMTLERQERVEGTDSSIESDDQNYDVGEGAVAETVRETGMMMGRREPDVEVVDRDQGITEGITSPTLPKHRPLLTAKKRCTSCAKVVKWFGICGTGAAVLLSFVQTGKRVFLSQDWVVEKLSWNASDTEKESYPYMVFWSRTRDVEKKVECYHPWIRDAVVANRGLKVHEACPEKSDMDGIRMIFDLKQAEGVDND